VARGTGELVVARQPDIAKQPLAEACLGGIKGSDDGNGRDRLRGARDQIRELTKIGFANIGDFIAVEEGVGAIVDFGTATREQMASLKSVELDERPAARARLPPRSRQLH
jgi:hypothetical protein